MKKLILTLAAAALGITVNAQGTYKFIVPISLADNETIVMRNFDNGDTLNTAKTKEGAVVFEGEIDEPVVVRLFNGADRCGTYILEEGTTSVNQEKRRAVGGMYNDIFNAYTDTIDALLEPSEKEPSDSIRNQLINAYKQITEKFIEDNIDNVLGYYAFVDYAYSLSPDEFFAFLEQYPTLKEYKRVQNLMNTNTVMLETSPGKPFKDFEITYDGTTSRLSDYVGKDKYVLVDFWASWCGPCMREIKNLKEINEQYKDKNFEILGVAVWDEPENTLSAIKRAEIPWHCILNAQTIPTDLYGIPGIPCIILFGPDGTILSRGLQGEALKADIAKFVK